MPSRQGLLRMAKLTRRQLIIFALVSAVINGIVTAAVGAWLAQTYTAYQTRRQSIQGLAHLIYERRTRAGMVISSLRRGADTDEVKYRKKAYDEVFVTWNTRIQQNVLQIREVMGERDFSKAEQDFQDLLVQSLAQIDVCLTKAYDLKLAGQDPLPLIDVCQFNMLHQVVLDCAFAITNELYKLTRLSFLPFSTPSAAQREEARQSIVKGCARPPLP